MINWSQHRVQGQGESGHETPSCTPQQHGRNVQVVAADVDGHGRHPGIDKAKGSQGGADECQGVGKDKGVENIAPSKHRRSSVIIAR